MRVCFVDYDMSILGGAEQVCASLANEFCEEHDVFIYELNRKNNQTPYVLDEKIFLREGSRKEEQLRVQIKNNFFPFIKFINENKIDIVMLIGNYPALITVLTRFFTKAKYVYCDHGALINQLHQKDITFIRLLNAWCSQCVVALTEQTKEDYIKYFKLPRKKVYCIYNWIDRIKDNCDYNLETKKIISVGRFGKEKGYDMLVQVAEKVFHKHPDWSWDVYGDGEMFEEIKQEVQKRKLEENLFLKGAVTNSRELHFNYAFLVLTSYREGLPLVLLEAKSNYLPAISFDIMTGPSEIIEDQKNGLLVTAFDLREMEDKINLLIENPELRLKYAKEAHSNIKKFSKKHILEQWNKLFRVITKNKK